MKQNDMFVVLKFLNLSVRNSGYYATLKILDISLVLKGK